MGFVIGFALGVATIPLYRWGWPKLHAWLDNKLSPPL